MPATIYRLYRIDTGKTTYIGSTTENPPEKRWKQLPKGEAFEELLVVPLAQRRACESTAILSALRDGEKIRNKYLSTYVEEPKFVGFRIPQQDYEDFKTLAGGCGLTFSAGMRLAVRRALADRIAFLTGKAE